MLTFETVSRFDYNHDAANDGLILSCSVTIADGGIEFACNPWDQPPGPFVREVVRIPVVDADHARLPSGGGSL
ncbi:hypothetical protein C6Q03_22045 [Burkholderia multivorans]|nr:hypothetical protein C6Q03_22045 [Burkholderia multivorans]